MKIDYKITTLILAVLLLVTYSWHWNDIFFHNKNYDRVENRRGMHQMPDGSLMMNHGGSMMDMTMNDMVSMMEGRSGKDLEKEFILGMIPHHQGAIQRQRLLV